MDGVLNVDKHAGPSSAAIVHQVKSLSPPGTKVGHAGTLDPFATGVLLVLVGRGTRLSQSLMDQPKQYEATVKLGATTATDDADSPEAPTARAEATPLETVEQVLQGMVGTVLQRPPDYSAMKIGGRRAYDLARRGKAVELAARPVRIDSIEVVSYQWPLLRLRIDCGKGTYIRSIARDLGGALGVGGYLTELRRTKVGKFAAKDAVDLRTLVSDGVERHLYSLLHASQGDL